MLRLKRQDVLAVMQNFQVKMLCYNVIIMLHNVIVMWQLSLSLLYRAQLELTCFFVFFVF